MICENESPGQYLAAKTQLKAEQDVFIADHAWTFQPESARASLESNPQLLRRIAGMTGVACEPIDCGPPDSDDDEGGMEELDEDDIDVPQDETEEEAEAIVAAAAESKVGVGRCDAFAIWESASEPVQDQDTVAFHGRFSRAKSQPTDETEAAKLLANVTDVDVSEKLQRSRIISEIGLLRVTLSLHCPHLYALDLQRNAIPASMVPTVVDLVAALPSLRALWLNGNPIHADVAARNSYRSSLLQSGSKLELLDRKLTRAYTDSILAYLGKEPIGCSSRVVSLNLSNRGLTHANEEVSVYAGGGDL